jgi:hypothetical protein
MYERHTRDKGSRVMRETLTLYVLLYCAHARTAITALPQVQNARHEEKEVVSTQSAYSLAATGYRPIPHHTSGARDWPQRASGRVTSNQQAPKMILRASTIHDASTVHPPSHAPLCFNSTLPHPCSSVLFERVCLCLCIFIHVEFMNCHCCCCRCCRLCSVCLCIVSRAAAASISLKPSK